MRERLMEIIESYLMPTDDHPGYPSYAGAVLLVSVDAAVRVREAVGDAWRYDTGPVELPADRRVRMRPDSIFDIASISKLFTTVLLLRQVEAGRVGLDEPVWRYLPEFEHQRVTVAMLLTHTSGLPPLIDLPTRPDVPARRAAILEASLAPGAVPGTVFRYSDVGMLLLGLLLERVSGMNLDKLVADEITGPLGMVDTGYNPAPADPDRLVATEAKADRGLCRGVVHDENAHSLGGIAGHAGLFSTADDLHTFARALLNNRLLAPETTQRMLVNANEGLPAEDPENRPNRAAHGLGVDLDQPWYMGRLSSPVTFGHTGFTGTSLIIDPRRRLVAMLLTNRVHPDRAWGGVNATRVAVADALADAVEILDR